MPSSVLMVYQPLEGMERRGYWESYIKFYESYWGGPTSPFGVWFGQEYENFRHMLSEQLGIERDEIVDCYFMKSQGRYFLCPLLPGANPYLRTAENTIPFEWFVPFEDGERMYLHAQWGFGSIYYHTKISAAIERIVRARGIIDGFMESPEDGGAERPFRMKLSSLGRKLNELEAWLSDFDPEGFLLLNYGELASLIHPFTLRNERSVFELWHVLELTAEGRIEEARVGFTLLEEKWKEIRLKAMGEEKEVPIQ